MGERPVSTRAKHITVAAGGAGALFLLVAAAALREYAGVGLPAQTAATGESGRKGPESTPIAATTGSELLERLYRDQISDTVITLSGTVVRTLPDDNDGSRHQRFILQATPQRTVLVAHNIDLAERVPMRTGDAVTVRGEYEWTQQGGTIHWTHHDPQGWRAGGWIEHAGIRYE